MSYIEFYKLKEQPFTNTVDTKFYYNSVQHSEALLRLKHAINTMKGLAVLVGSIGTGKTTLARRMLDELNEKEYESALLVIIHANITPEWLLKKIITQLGVEELPDDKTELLSKLCKRLIEIHEEGKKAVVLIDEAQMLQTKELMEEFRGILNIETDGNKLITFVLFGMPELDACLSLDEPLKQRIAMRFKLQSFEESTTEEYIKFRLKIAGCSSELFTKDALEAIHNYSHGIPRLINTICDNALLEGFLRKKQRIDANIIKEVVNDLGLTNNNNAAAK
ncbi:MAG: AAA family ATPase [Nitrospirae bacterium]|nr:AAA family ATPase [Nitrospirota bacterium]